MDKKFDPDQPLEDPRYEKFCQLRAEGISQKEAYEQAGFKAGEASVHAAASRLSKRPEVKSRLRVLQMQAIVRADGEGDLTPEEVKATLTTIFRTASGTDRLNALKHLQSEFKVLGDETEKRPDPCALLAYLTTFGGKTGEQIIRELGGLEFVEARLSETLKANVTIKR